MQDEKRNIENNLKQAYNITLDFRLKYKRKIENYNGSLYVEKITDYFINNITNNMNNNILEYLPNTAKLVIRSILREKESNLLQKVIENEINSLCQDKIIIDHTSRILTTIDISKGKSCSKCLISIDNYLSQYYCYWCDIYFCFTCGGSYDLTKQGLEVLPHFHNLILLNVKHNSRAMKNIVKVKLGNTVILKILLL